MRNTIHQIACPATLYNIACAQAQPGAHPSRQPSPSSSTGSSELRAARAKKDSGANALSPDSAVNQPGPAFRVQDTSTSSGQALPGDLSHQLSQQADGGAKTAVAVRQKTNSPPPGFAKPKAAAAVASKGAKPALLPLPSAWLRSRALQPTAAAFDPTAGARQRPQAEPSAASDAPSTSQQNHRAEVQGTPRVQSGEEDQGAKRSRTDQNMHGHRILREDTPEEEAAPQLQQHPRQEDVQVARPQLESSLAAGEEEASARQAGEEDEQMAGNHRASDLAQNEEDETGGSQQGSGPDVEDVHMMGTTPPSSSGMQHLAAAAASTHSSSHQASRIHGHNIEKQGKVQRLFYKTYTAWVICKSTRQSLSYHDVPATLWCSPSIMYVQHMLADNFFQPLQTALCNSSVPSANDITRQYKDFDKIHKVADCCLLLRECMHIHAERALTDTNSDCVCQTGSTHLSGRRRY